jgi:hypothetical protein
MFHSRALWAVLAGITFASISTAAPVKTTSAVNKTSKTAKVVKTKAAKSQAKVAYNCEGSKCEDKKSCPMKTKTASAKTAAKAVLKCCEHEAQ